MMKTKLIRWATTDRTEQASDLPSVRDLLAKGWRVSGPHPTRPTMWLMSVEVEAWNSRCTTSRSASGGAQLSSAGLPCSSCYDA